MNKRIEFASDNYSGMCPEAMDAVNRCNDGPALAYGNDDSTRAAAEALRNLFEKNCEVFFVFNGTAANSLALASLCQSYHSVICHELAHIETDECGAPEFASNGSKLLLARGRDGRLTPAEILKLVNLRSDIHYPKPKVVSLTQSTELGTVYSPESLSKIHDVASEKHLKIHMDGARFANAVASLGVTPADLTWKRGVDVLCFSGTKNGMAYGEAILFFDPEQAEDFAYRCKQAGQLASKMRFMTAPWTEMIETGVWLENAKRANDSARYLATKLESSGLVPMFSVESNAVFLDLGAARSEALKQRGWHFYTFIGNGGARFVCDWSTEKSAIDDLVRDILDVS